jgi:hypothetical protein
MLTKKQRHWNPMALFVFLWNVSDCNRILYSNFGIFRKYYFDLKIIIIEIEKELFNYCFKNHSLNKNQILKLG